MIVQFDKPVCLQHRLPLSYICKDFNCACPVKLCSQCVKIHHKKVSSEQEFIKENVFINKLQIQTEIVAKEYKNIHKYAKMTDKSSSLLSSKNQDSIHCVEIIMKSLNQDKRSINKNIDQFNSNHFEVKKKINKVRNSHQGNYLASLVNQKIILMNIFISSQKGLQRLWEKVSATTFAVQKYQDFLNAVKKYGSKNKQFLEGLGYKSTKLLRNKIENILCQWRGNRKVQVCLDLHIPENHIQERKRCGSRTPRAKLESPRKRIFMITDRPRAVSGKQN